MIHLESLHQLKKKKNLKEEISYLNKIIDKMKVRDTEILLLKKENKDLREQYTSNRNNMVSIDKD